MTMALIRLVAFKPAWKPNVRDLWGSADFFPAKISPAIIIEIVHYSFEINVACYASRAQDYDLTAFVS